MKIRLRDINDQTIVITGATSGIGLTTAKMAADRGAHVILVSRSEDSLESVVEEIRADGGMADFVECDVGEREEVARVVKTVVKRFGGFDTWVNNAGIGAYSRLEDLSDRDHHRVFDTNYWGVVYGTMEALKYLKPRGGAIINVGSISSELPAPVLSAYTASKFAVKGFTDSLRLELMHDRVPVSLTLIQPSGIHTPFGEHALNNMDARSQVPAPVYHPKLVARAIIRSAESPRRDVIIGESGKLQIAMIRHLPRLGDYILSKLFFRNVLEEDQPKRKASALHEAGRPGDMLGDQEGMIHRFSPYTEAKINPRMTAASLLGGGLIIAGACALVSSWKRNHNSY